MQKAKPHRTRQRHPASSKGFSSASPPACHATPPLSPAVTRTLLTARPRPQRRSPSLRPGPKHRESASIVDSSRDRHASFEDDAFEESPCRSEKKNAKGQQKKMAPTLCLLLLSRLSLRQPKKKVLYSAAKEGPALSICEEDS